MAEITAEISTERRFEEFQVMGWEMSGAVARH